MIKKIPLPKLTVSRIFYALDVLKLLLIFVLFLLFVNFNIKLSQEIQATKGLSTQLASSAKQRTNQINDLSHHIDCIIDLFGTQNRTDYYITNPQTCHISQVPKTTSASGGSTGSTKSGR